MSNIGRTVKIMAEPLGTIVEQITVRGKPKYKVALADGQPRNPVLGDFTIVGLECQFMDDAVFAEPDNLGFADMRQVARRQSYNR
jgi:hypothetical protein